VEVERGEVGVGWLQAGFVLFAFAAPSAVVGVAYSVGMAGLLGGPLLCLVVTVASVGGSLMLLRMRLELPGCRTLGDLGLEILGRPGKIWGDVIQLGNFVLFLPVALLLCATALEGVVTIPAFKGCNDYYIFSVAVLCLLTTQMRTLQNTQVLSAISVVCVFGIATLQIIAAMQYSMEDGRIPARLFGNPEKHWIVGGAEALLGATTAAWAYVPAFLTVELTTCMRSPKHLAWSLVFSGALNVVIFVGVGVTVVERWGYDVSDPVTLTRVAAWDKGGWLDKSLSLLLLIGNFVSYSLDSVPLARFCQRAWLPDFADTWSAKDVSIYFMCTLPTFLCGLLLSLAVPNLFVLLAFTTALTVPWVTQIYPAALYWKRFCASSSVPGRCEPGRFQQAGLWERLGVAAVLGVGMASFVVCLAAAVGKVALIQLRGPSQIGCAGWIIWRG